MNIYKALLAITVTSLSLSPCLAAQSNQDYSSVRPCVVKGCVLPVYPKISDNQSVELEVNGLPNHQEAIVSVGATTTTTFVADAN